MSKDKARNPESYANEELLLAMLPGLLEGKGFIKAVTRRKGAMKFVDATTLDGSIVTFWMKQGWSNTRDYSAIQFGMLPAPDAGSLPDSVFIDFVAARTASAKSQGASHALLVHMHDARISNYVAMRIDDVARAYSAQIAGWPRRARATKMPTLFFEDSRNLHDAGYVQVVTEFEVALEFLSGSQPSENGLAKPASKKITAEIERRMAQAAFRLAVGERCGWKCMLSGVGLREVLDAAHLPGRDWRLHNSAADGVLLRADLHRLLDRGLAEIREGCFWISTGARHGHYEEFHNRIIANGEASAMLGEHN
jgi:hypothetical protein